MSANSGTCSRFLLNSSKADSLVLALNTWLIQSRTRLLSSLSDWSGPLKMLPEGWSWLLSLPPPPRP